METLQNALQGIWESESPTLTTAQAAALIGKSKSGFYHWCRQHHYRGPINGLHDKKAFIEAYRERYRKLPSQRRYDDYLRAKQAKADAKDQAARKKAAEKERLANARRARRLYAAHLAAEEAKAKEKALAKKRDKRAAKRAATRAAATDAGAAAHRKGTPRTAPAKTPPSPRKAPRHPATTTTTTPSKRKARK
jgi:hypothetical protein